MLVCRERCTGCLSTGLEDAMARTGAGMFLRNVVAIDESSEWGFRMDLDEITAREYSALKILRSEKQRWRDEQERNRQDEARAASEQ